MSTTILAEWGSHQHFIGSFYLIVDPTSGRSKYGSAEQQWLNMHEKIGPDLWVKVTPVAAYAVDQPQVIPTLIEEARVTIEEGDWAVRQPGGEVQHIRAEKMPLLYFTSEEAEQLGLTPDNFADYARATASVMTG